MRPFGFVTRSGMTYRQAMESVVWPCWAPDGSLLTAWGALGPHWGYLPSDWAWAWMAKARLVLDFGAGIGRNAKKVLEAFPRVRVVAYEPDDDHRAWINAYVASGPLARCDAETPPRAKFNPRLYLAATAADFAGIGFDGAMSITVVQHLSREARREAVAILAAAIKPGGHLTMLERAWTDDAGFGANREAGFTYDALEAPGSGFALVQDRQVGDGVGECHETLWRRA